MRHTNIDHNEDYLSTMRNYFKRHKGTPEQLITYFKEKNNTFRWNKERDDAWKSLVITIEPMKNAKNLEKYYNPTIND